MAESEEVPVRHYCLARMLAFVELSNIE